MRCLNSRCFKKGKKEARAVLMIEVVGEVVVLIYTTLATHLPPPPVARIVAIRGVRADASISACSIGSRFRGGEATRSIVRAKVAIGNRATLARPGSSSRTMSEAVPLVPTFTLIRYSIQHFLYRLVSTRARLAEDRTDRAAMM